MGSWNVLRIYTIYYLENYVRTTYIHLNNQLMDLETHHLFGVKVSSI